MFSFDIFDTLLTRRTAVYDGIFYIIQNYIRDSSEEFSDYMKNNFYRLRVQSELFARRRYCKGDVEDITLLQIYQTMSLLGIIENSQILTLKKIEEEIEVENILGIKENIELVKELVSRGERVVAISDMYLSSDVIRRMFRKAGLPDIPLYISSETKQCKWTGNMFRYVMRTEHVEYKEWYHKGDNIDSDYRIPCKYGISAKHYPYITLDELDNKLLEYRNQEVQLLVGNIKNVLVNTGKLNCYGVLGVKIAGILFYPYIRWVLDECLERKIEKIYFISSKGNILKSIADKMICLNQYSIRTECINSDTALDVREKNICFLSLTNSRECEEIITKNLKKGQSENIYGFYYFFSTEEIKIPCKYKVFSQLEVCASNLLSVFYGMNMNEGQIWDSYLEGILDFVDVALDDKKSSSIRPKMEIVLTYLDGLLSVNEGDMSSCVKDILNLEKKETDTKSVKLLNDLKRESNIIIYGAGSLGQHIYSQIAGSGKYHIVLWADRWFEECRSRGLQVDNPEKIKKTKFDYILIAVVDKVKAEDIKQSLLQMNVKRDKIIWINSYETI